MAAKFYNSTAAGAATGADWTNAYTSLALAAAGLAAGDTLWVGDNSAESVAGAITATFPGTAASPNFIYCVDHTQALPGTGDLKTTATVTTTGANAITLAGTLYCYGVIFSSGNGANTVAMNIANVSGNCQIFDNCALRSAGTTGGSIHAASLSLSVWNNTTIQAASAGAIINISGKLIWKNTSSAISGATIPTTLFGNTNMGDILLEGVDLSALSGKTVFPAVSAPVAFTLKDCKLPASVTISAAQTSAYLFPVVNLIRCDSAATNYRQERHTSVGDLTTETTIVRTGGATDGTTLLAHKIVTNANSKWIFPFESIPITFWNDSTSAMTLTLFGTWLGGAVPNNDDIWIDIEYPGDASSGQGSFLSGTKANNLATGSAQTTDASTWGGGTTNFKMVSGSFTPAQKGPITIYVRAAKASTTFYIDPRPLISGLTISKSEIIAPGVYINELSSGGAASSGVQGSRIRLGM